MICDTLVKQCSKVQTLARCRQLSSCQKLVTHVIFDLDGTLLDSEHVYPDACRQITSMFSKPFPLTLRSELIGLARREATPMVLEKTGLKEDLTVKEFNRLLDKVISPMLPKIIPMPGAMELVRHLAAHKIPMAICTGSTQYEYKLKLKNIKELAALIPLVVTGDDPEITVGKPAADPYLVTMRRFQEQPRRSSDVMVFEDSLIGIQAARSAGARVTLVYDKRHALPTQNIDVDFIANSLQTIDLQLLGLPPYECTHSGDEQSK